VAAVDCGTNSVRLLVTRGETDLLRRMEIVRLGQDVDRTGRLDPAAIARTRVVLESYAADITRLGAAAVRMVATSATRDASNRAEFVAMVRQVLGVSPEVVSGQQEAALSYAGATAGLSQRTRWPVLVVDIGGGSTEFAWGPGPGAVGGAYSADIGCVRLTERFLHSDPPTRMQRDAAEEHVRAALDAAFDGAALDRAGPLGTLVGLAGSVTTVAAYVLDLPGYDADRIHGTRLPASDVQAAAAELLAMSRAQRAALPFMHPGRADVIGGGALVLAAVLTRTGLDAVTVSEHDILDGIAASLLPGPTRGPEPRVAESELPVPDPYLEA
jgi:exopolyphosphatase/guanosine-5'-triphosphate,3'-diphosphate pyrophosphatase